MFTRGMDTTRFLTFVCLIWAILLYDVCSAARAGGSSSKTGSNSNAVSNSAGFVGGVDTASPQFTIFMMIFLMFILTVVVFLIIMLCKIKRYCCFKLPGMLPGSTTKIHIADSVKAPERWSITSDTPSKKSSLPPLQIVTDTEKEPANIPSILKQMKGYTPRTMSPDSAASFSLPPIITLPYPDSARTDSFTPPPEPELTEGSSESESESDTESESATLDEGVDSAISDRSQSQQENFYPTSEQLYNIQ